jgi:signal transduction histidine kinase
MLTGSAQIKGIGIKSNLQSNIFVYADYNMLLTILRNLITNAIKFSKEGDSITLDVIEKDDSITVKVIDTGVGIKSEDLNKLFRLDENLKTEGTANETGTGLGLILCKEFVEKNNGTIWVESVLGKGSSFSFTLQKGKAV